MRNLRTIHRSLLRPPNGPSPTASTWDPATDSIISAIGPTPSNPLLELHRWRKYAKSYSLIASWDTPPPPPNLNLDCDAVLSIHHFSDTRTTCLVLAGGDLVLVRESPLDGEEDKIEIVGSVDAGICAAAWAPDEELLALTTNAATLVFMTRDFEVVADVGLHVDDLKVSTHVDVGWGKKETQFKGKKARGLLRDPTVPERVDEGSLSDCDDGATTRISWRGDGAYLAVNCAVDVMPQSRRVIRVYSREGVLDSVSEPVNGLEGALSWRPAGNVIAGVQRLDGVLRVVFFERNGLRHGQFDLRLSKEDVADWGRSVELQWNVDSTVLAVAFLGRVQLWTMGNYHYYLKQQIISCDLERPFKLPSLLWHPEKPLHVLTASKDAVQRLAYGSVISASPTTPPYDYGIVAVIDGTSLKLTPLRLANVPPPMALQELELASNVIDVTMTLKMRPEASFLIAVLHSTDISIYDWPVKSMAQTHPNFVRACALHHEDDQLLWPIDLQISFVSEDYLVVLRHTYNITKELIISTHDPRSMKWYPNHGKSIEGIVSPGPLSSAAQVLLLPDQDTENGFTELSKEIATSNHDGSSGQNNCLPILKVFPSPSACVEAINYICKSSTDGSHVNPGTTVFSLAENGSLFANGRCLARQCTSFLVTPAHLIFTTSQHLLKFVHLGNEDSDLDIPPDTPETDERCRSLERGARLVTVMPSIFALVLQMPRGNLETIYPRALVLAGIRDSINIRKYKKAFMACRSQRVDMNILHDHAPQQFLESVGLFVDQVKKPEYIDLFLSGLKEEDVTKTMYRETLKLSSLTQGMKREKGTLPNEAVAGVSKVNRICDAFLDALDLRPGHIQNIISAHVCKQPPDLDAGLLQIAKLRKQRSEQVNEAIEHICFLADVNRLYDSALGLYDLELTLLIAQQSQKDPREYLPFLQDFQRMPELRRKHSIDDYLKRYTKALSSLCALDAFEEVKSYTVKHVLYISVLETYRYREAQLSTLTRLYADYLYSEGSFRDAAIAYEYLHDYNLASSTFRQAHLWKESLSCALLIPLPEPELQILAQTLASSCLEAHDFYSAATIHHDHLSDIPTAASIFCKGHFYVDAHRAIALARRLDLLETLLDTGLVEGMATMTELLAELKAQLNAQVPRIHELRTKKAIDPLAFYDGDALPGEDGADIPDNVSLAPTDASTAGGGTLFTRYTNRSSGTLATNATRRSSKNRRREERKRARGKKGSVYEEEYLVASVRRLIERVNTVEDEVKRLVAGLMRRGMRERAKAVEGGMMDVVSLCQGCVGEVFGAGKDDNEEKVKKENDEVDGGVNGGHWDEVGGASRPEPPVVTTFERLSLLGP